MRLSEAGPLQTMLRREDGGDGRRLDLFKIGPILKGAREGRALSLASVAQALYIKISSLDAIESGSWDALPHSIYVKGYIKAYAAYLGISQKIEPDLVCAEPLPAESSKRDETPKVRNHTWLKKLLIICSSVTGLILGIAFSPGLQVPPPVRLGDLLTACHSAIMGMRKIMLP